MEVYKVQEINNYIKRCLESFDTLKAICVEGEMSNVTYQAKHMYFTLKDNQASISVAGFNYQYNDVPKNLKAGDKVKVYGSINVYAKTAGVQIVCNRIEKANSLGELYIRLEKLKKEYLEKGYFEDVNKKTLPKYPNKIGVVTAHTGAAVHDIINTTHKRNPNVDIYVYSAKVQGDGCSESVAKGIKYFNDNMPELDCLIIGRGGGSIEDLWGFNEVPVIEAIHDSNIPVISAVGHEVDVLLSDYVADKRAATPTQAAEILIPVKNEIVKGLNELRRRTSNTLIKKVEFARKELSNIKNNYYIKEFYSNKILEGYNELENLKKDLRKVIISKLSTKDKREKLNYLAKRLKSLCNDKINMSAVELNSLKLKLEKYDVSDLFDRGFTVTLKNGKLLKNTRPKKGDKLETIYGKNKKVRSEVYE